LVNEIRTRCGECPESVVNAVVEAVRRYSVHEQHDDITIIAAKCRV
jgi:serine phosphatase RsbU (regulator of sigma subunit)